MASKLSTRLLPHLARSHLAPRACLLQLSPSPWSGTPHLSAPRYSTADANPPLLAKLKGDLKTAMKAKDTARLAVLRSVLAATLNASKTASPVRTDAQLVALLRKTARASAEAADEFRAAGRDDLVAKEEAQIAVLEEYCAGSGIESIDGEALKQLVEAVKGELAGEGLVGKAALGEAMKRVIGKVEGKDVDKAEVTRLVKEIVLGP